MRFCPQDLRKRAYLLVILAFNHTQQGRSKKQAVFVRDNVAVIDDRDHISHGQRQQIGPVTKERAQVEHATIMLTAPVHVWMRELVAGHAAKLEHASNRITE